MILNDIWYVVILGRHKHKYRRIEDGYVEVQTQGMNVNNVAYQRHQCLTCKKIVGLDESQIKSLPTHMLYEMICEINQKE